MATYSTTLNIASEGTYNIELNRWTATINLTTTSTDFYNHEIIVSKDGTNVGTIAFNNAGQATYEVHEIGSYRFTLNYSEDEVYYQTASVTAEGTYDITLNRWTATIRIYTAAEDFHYENLTVTKDGDNLGTITIDNSGYAYYQAHADGEYVFTLNYSDKESYEVKVNAVDDGGTYDGTITRWTATLNLSTTTTEFYGHEIIITKGGDPYDTVHLSSAGSLSYDVHEAGSYKMQLVFSDDESYEANYTITTNGQVSSQTITRWTATVNLSTTSPDFYNHDIKVLKDNVEYATIKFSATGTYAYSVHQSGVYKFVVEYSASETYERQVTVSAQQSYSVEINRWTATINLSTSSSELTGATLTVYQNGTNFDTVSLPSTTSGVTTYKVHDPAIYKFALVYSGTEYSATVEVTAESTYTANVSLKPALVSWVSGSDDAIKAMIDGYYDGKLTLDEIKSVWEVGQARTITLGAIAATGVGESHRSQAVEMVILDFNHDELASPVNGKTNALITVQQKNCLRDATVADDAGSSNTEHGYMNSSNTNVNGWNGCARRTWCNGVYYEALPSGFKDMVKEAKHTSTKGNKDTSTEVTTDKCFLPSEWEVFGATTYAGAREGTQYEYYKTAANRYKLPKWNSSSVSDFWWERSPCGSSTTYFCNVAYNGNANGGSASFAYGLAPACCL